MSKKILIVDPPSGWQYGFPKPIPDKILQSDEDFKNWLVAEGYPQEMLELALKHSRYWEAQDDSG